MTGDTYKRIQVAPSQYQCGCRWVWDHAFGDVLIECAIHKQATEARVREFDRERSQP